MIVTRPVQCKYGDLHVPGRSWARHVRALLLLSMISSAAYNLNHVLLLFARETDHVRRLSHMLTMYRTANGMRLPTSPTVDFLFRCRLFIYCVLMLRIIINGSSTTIELERAAIDVALTNP